MASKPSVKAMPTMNVMRAAQVGARMAALEGLNLGPRVASREPNATPAQVTKVLAASGRPSGRR